MDNYRDFMEEPSAYCRKMEQENEWADGLIIQVTSAMLKRRITIITDGVEKPIYDVVPNNNNDEYLYMMPIYLGFIQNNHYVTLKYAGPIEDIKMHEQLYEIEPI